MIKMILNQRWRSMKHRCNNPNAHYYKYYGGRGIKVCDEWLNNFDSFYEWAINNGFSKELSIDRKNNDKGYSPDNCRWVTEKIQKRNTSRANLVEYKGESWPLADLCEKFDFPYSVMYQRLRKGMPFEAAIKIPPKKYSNFYKELRDKWVMGMGLADPKDLIEMVE